MATDAITPEYEQEAEKFYKKLIQILKTFKHPFLIGGTYAVKFYTGIDRPTKDIDIFCKAGDYPKILKKFQDQGYQVVLKDDRWLAKVYSGTYFADIIFGSIPSMWPITNGWIEAAPIGKILGEEVHITPPEELIVSKAYRMGRRNFDGADVTHIILKCNKDMDWKRLLSHMEPYWEILLIHLLLFRFTYPADRNAIPRWLMDELISRVQNQLDIPSPEDKVCRGSILSHKQYEIAYTDWGYKDISQFFERKS